MAFRQTRAPAVRVGLDGLRSFGKLGLRWGAQNGCVRFGLRRQRPCGPFNSSRSATPFARCAQVAKVREAALAEDPNVFDYDTHYDAIHEAREGPKRRDREKKSSRYVESLLGASRQGSPKADSWATDESLSLSRRGTFPGGLPTKRMRSLVARFSPTACCEFDG